MTWDKATVEEVLETPVTLTRLTSDRLPPVVHVCVVRDIQRGRLVRRAGERLCTVGKIRSETTTGLDAATCPYCIARLTAEQTRVVKRKSDHIRKHSQDGAVRCAICAPLRCSKAP